MKPESMQLGANLSDLVVGVCALLSENEGGALLEQRITEVKASALAIIAGAEALTSKTRAEEAKAAKLNRLAQP